MVKVGVQLDSATAKPFPEFPSHGWKDVQLSLSEGKDVRIRPFILTPDPVLGDSKDFLLVSGKGRYSPAPKILDCQGSLQFGECDEHQPVAHRINADDNLLPVIVNKPENLQTPAGIS
jgi:hypothetical protein